MTQLSTKPVRPRSRPRADRVQSDPATILIQVPQVDVTRPHAGIRGRLWRPGTRGDRQLRPDVRRSSGQSPRPYHAARTFSGPGTRPRRRLRRGVRTACGWLLIVAAMGATFTMGWTIRGNRSPGAAGNVDSSAPLYAMAPDADETSHRDPGAPSRRVAGESVSREAIAGHADASGPSPTLDAPVADADSSIVFPGYVLPDDRLEEPAHEGS